MAERTTEASSARARGGVRGALSTPARRWLLAGLVVALVLALLLGRGQLERMEQSFLDADWRWALVAMGLLLASLVLRSWALKVIVDAPGDVRARLGDAFSATSIGLLANVVLPVRVGVVVTPYVLTILLRRRRASLQFATALGMGLTERLFATVTFAFLGLAFVSTLAAPSWAVRVLVLATVASIACLGALALVERWWERRAAVSADTRRLDVRLPRIAARSRLSRLGQGIAHYLPELIDSQRVMGRPSSVLLESAVQTLSWLVQAAAALAALEAFHLDEAGLRGAALVLVLTNIIALIPATPGNVGTFQAAAVAALAVYGVESGPAIAFALGFQAMQLVVAVGAGLLSLSLQRLTLAQLRGSTREVNAGLYQTTAFTPPRVEGR